MKLYLDVEDLAGYQKLCRRHIEICDLNHGWPLEAVESGWPISSET